MRISHADQDQDQPTLHLVLTRQGTLGVCSLLAQARLVAEARSQPLTFQKPDVTCPTAHLVSIDTNKLCKLESGFVRQGVVEQLGQDRVDLGFIAGSATTAVWPGQIQ